METKEEWNKQVDHPLQSFEWGEFRKLSGVESSSRAACRSRSTLSHIRRGMGYCPRENYQPRTGKILAKLRRK